MNTPSILLVFDIDATLLRYDNYKTIEQIRDGLYDKNLLTPYLGNSNYQVALASFNNDAINNPYYNGFRLGRAILDIQHHSGNSNERVSDEFIQAWIFNEIEYTTIYGKNFHLKNLVLAFQKKYGKNPEKVILYDDNIINCFLANKMNVTSFYVTDGLTKANINKLETIKNRVLINIKNNTVFFDCMKYLEKYIYPQNFNFDSVIIHLYLPSPKEYGKKIFKEFLTKLNNCNIRYNILKFE